MKIGRLARWYRWIEYAAYGRALERTRFTLLPRLAFTRRVLVLGEGDGRTLARLLRAAPQAQIDIIELSPEMIEQAKARIGDEVGITFQCQDVRTAMWPTGHYDGIVTNFILDCFSETEARDLIEKLAVTLKPAGIWLIAEFAIPPGGWRSLHAKVWIATMYRFFSITTGLRATKLPPIEALMREAGMQCVEREEQRAGLMISERWAKSPPHDFKSQRGAAQRTSPGTSAP